MLRGLGSWLGLERAGEEKLLSAEERSSSAEEEEAAAAAGAEPAEPQADSEALLSQAKGLGSECPARAVPLPASLPGALMQGQGSSGRIASLSGGACRALASSGRGGGGGGACCGSV